MGRAAELVVQHPAQEAAGGQAPVRRDALPTPAEASGLVGALEGAWAAIRQHHGDVLPAVIVLASGTSGRAAKLGHYAASRWDVSGRTTAEVLVAGEGLRLGAEEILGTLLHEAAHGAAHARQVVDTSRGGRYHNRRYARLAGELGLAVSQHRSLGWAVTALGTGTAERYARQLEVISGALRLWRRDEARPGSAAGGTALVACRCSCGRRLRASRTVVDEAPIVCGRCGEPFVG